MPLQSAKSESEVEACVSANMRQLAKDDAAKPKGERRPQKQRVAIAISEARKNLK